MSDNTPDAAAPQPGAYPPPAPGAYPPPQAAPPAYGAPTAYGSPQSNATPPQYAAPQAYGATPQYGAAAPYGYGAPAKTNTLAIVSLVASLAGLLIVPFIGSIVGVITGHMSLGQLKTSGEEGRGLALAGTIIGWVGLGLAIIGIIALIGFIAFVASVSESPYS